MSLGDLLFGKRLATLEESEQRLSPVAGIGVFGLDALSSAGYGPEAALTLLIPLGALGVQYEVPISAGIIALLVVVFISYLQTIAAYPGGGGSYTVARENLGHRAALLAAAALIVDYILVVAVGISAGVGALVSALPALHPHTLAICLGILAVVTLINLRGVRETGAVFMVPTYLFIGSLLSAIAWGIFQSLSSGGRPIPVIAPHPLQATLTSASAWVLLQAFSSGCTAMTGVEAVSNGVKAFREPAVTSARKTLTAIIGILILMLGGIAWLAREYHIGASNPGEAGYESVLSQLLGAVSGHGAFYYVAMGSVVLVLALSANTAFSDFPRLCQIVAEDNYLPHAFTTRGRRLVFSQGIYVLAFLAGALLVIFKGVTDRLIPLFAVGAFLAFTLSQAGMVVHWKKQRAPGTWRSILVNGLGATATAVTLLVVLAAKFLEGAWVTVLLIPSLLAIMLSVHRHYARVAAELELKTPLDLTHLNPPLVVVPIQGWNKIAQKGLRFAINMSTDVYVLQVKVGEHIEDLRPRWCQWVERPMQELGLPVPHLRVMESPYRQIFRPILDFINDLAEKNPERHIAVLVPELVEGHWYHYLLHNQRAALLKGLLLVKGNRKINVINVPWYLAE